MAVHSSILVWKIPWSEEPDSCSPWGPKESDTTEWLSKHAKQIYNELSPHTSQNGHQQKIYK